MVKLKTKSITKTTLFKKILIEGLIFYSLLFVQPDFFLFAFSIFFIFFVSCFSRITLNDS